MSYVARSHETSRGGVAKCANLRDFQNHEKFVLRRRCHGELDNHLEQIGQIRFCDVLSDTGSIHICFSFGTTTMIDSIAILLGMWVCRITVCGFPNHAIDERSRCVK